MITAGPGADLVALQKVDDMNGTHDEDRPPWRMTVPKTAKRTDLTPPDPELGPEQVAALRTAREREGLPAEVDDILVRLARDLAGFRADGLGKLPTPRELKEQARQIRLSALHLQSLIAGCDTGVFLGLDSELLFEGISLENDDGARLGMRVCAVHDVLDALAKAAAQVEDTRAQVRSSRPHVTAALYGYIASLAHLLMPYGVIAAEGGRFGRLCEAVFSAGYPGGSHVGALRRFIKTGRSGMVADGLALGPKIPTGSGEDVCLDPSSVPSKNPPASAKTESSE